MVTTNAGPATAPPPARATGRFGLSPQAQGTLALAVTVLIWAAFALSARA